MEHPDTRPRSRWANSDRRKFSSGALNFCDTHGLHYNHFSSRLLEVRYGRFCAKNTEICRGQRPVQKRCELGHNRKSLNAFVEHITFLAVLHLLKKHDLAYLTLARSGCIEFVQLEFRNTVVWVYGVKRLQM